MHKLHILFLHSLLCSMQPLRGGKGNVWFHHIMLTQKKTTCGLNWFLQRTHEGKITFMLSPFTGEKVRIWKGWTSSRLICSALAAERKEMRKYLWTIATCAGLWLTFRNSFILRRLLKNIWNCSHFSQILEMITSSAVGNKGPVLTWFKSYLRFSAHLGECSSSAPPLTCGVPQRSTLGHLLYNIYLLPLGPVLIKYSISFHCFNDNQSLES